MDRSYDVIVLGLGAMGSAAAYQLAKRGARVLGLDRFAPPHDAGSTHGDTRLTRQAIGEGLAYTPLALRSNQIWREVERQTGQELYVQTGGLILSGADDSAIHGKPGFLQTTLAAAREYDIPHEVLAPEEVRRRFPPFRVRGDEVGYYEPGAGYLRPERCVAAQLGLAQDLEADLHVNERVLGFEPAGDGVRVQTDRGRYEAGRLIVSAGPWAAELLGDALRGLFRVYRQVLYWYDVAARYEEFLPGRFPVFIWGLGGGEDVYGFPALDGRGGGIKVAAEEYLAETTPESVVRVVSPEEKGAMYAGRVGPYLEGVTGECLRAVCCLYTVTPDFGFVIDTLPGLPQVILASPCSGHGFKHSAAIGEVLADLATVGESRLDVSSFRLGRFPI